MPKTFSRIWYSATRSRMAWHDGIARCLQSLTTTRHPHLRQSGRLWSVARARRRSSSQTSLPFWYDSRRGRGSQQLSYAHQLTHLPPQSPAMESDYLYELDKTTQEILQTVLTWQTDHPGESGGAINLTEGTLELPTHPLSLPQLQRLRRQYLGLNRQRTLAKNRIRENFVAYLNNSFQ